MGFQKGDYFFVAWCAFNALLGAGFVFSAGYSSANPIKEEVS